MLSETPIQLVFITEVPETLTACIIFLCHLLPLKYNDVGPTSPLREMQSGLRSPVEDDREVQRKGQLRQVLDRMCSSSPEVVPGTHISLAVQSVRNRASTSLHALHALNRNLHLQDRLQEREGHRGVVLGPNSGR